jgi:hypothetical protein
MKKINPLLIFTILLAINVSAQNKTGTGNLKNAATICSLVTAGGGGNVAEDAPLILYMQDSVQNRRVEIVFLQTVRKKMSYNPYDRLVNQNVCIAGKITQYNNAPAIIIRNENQIKTNEEQQVNRMNANH